MPTSENALIQMEAGQNFVSMNQLTDSGDLTKFDSADDLWSRKSGFTAVVLPNGMKTGGVITGTASNNQVAVSAGTANLNGVAVSVSANTTLAVTRTASGGAFQKNSIVVNSSGSYAAVAGAEGSSFSDVRGANGGPPFIATDAIEVGQVWMSSNTDAPIVSSEIKQVVGVHLEKHNYPLYQVKTELGQVHFVAALQANHTGGVGKRVYAQYYTPVFTTIPRTSDMVLPETSASVSSSQIYGEVLNSVSKSLGQGSFKAKLEDGITDLVAIEKGNFLWFKFYPDQYKSPYVLVQGVLSIARTFAADSFIEATCTISSEAAGIEKEA